MCHSLQFFVGVCAELTVVFCFFLSQVKGIIYPPPDIRAIVDKTARFVAKNGKSFEERIQASEEGKSAKFNFMRPHDPYYAYYEFKIRDFEENGDAPKPVKTNKTTL